MRFEAASLGERLSALFTLKVPFFRVDCLVICHVRSLRRSIVAGPTLKPAELEMAVQMTGEIVFAAPSVFSALMAGEFPCCLVWSRWTLVSSHLFPIVEFSTAVVASEHLYVLVNSDVTLQVAGFNEHLSARGTLVLGQNFPKMSRHMPLNMRFLNCRVGAGVASQ